MNCIILRKTFSILPFLQLLWRQKEETEGKEGEGGRVMRAGLSGSTEEDQQFGSPPSLPLCQKHSRGAFRPKWRVSVFLPCCHSKHSRSSWYGFHFSHLVALSEGCHRLERYTAFWKDWGIKCNSVLYKRETGKGKGKSKVSGAREWLDEDNVHK